VLVKPGAGTPEELEALFEDAFVLRDRFAVAGLFEDRAVLACALGPQVAQGRAAIAALARGLWDGDRTYVADLRQVLQAGDTALVIGTHVINVARRGPDGWRYAIALLDRFDDTTERKTHDE
jgi:ketosteroid isomerase-like protein